MRASSSPLWLLRVAWGLLAIVAAPAFRDALRGRSGAVQIVAAVGLWAGWAIVLAATLVPTPASLTVVRVLAPGSVAAAVVAAFAGAGAPAAIAAIGLAVVAVILAFTAEVGGLFVQAGAYGDESRHVLRPPGPLIAGPLELAWLALALSLGTGPLLLAARAWVAGGLLTAVGIVLAVLLGPRFHRLTLRWFVFVPAGVVVRDPLVLADTAMFRRPDVQHLALALVDTTATDLTGRALGPAVEVDLVGRGRITLAGTPTERQGQGVEIGGFLVSPSRPGRLLAEAERRSYSVRRV
jgi:hypothetical protein